MEAAAVLGQARNRSGLSLRQLAARAGTSHATIAAYESGSKVPTVATLARLLGACGFVAEIGLRAVDPFEDRRARGEELRAVLDLADQFPANHHRGIAGRFPCPPR